MTSPRHQLDSFCYRKPPPKFFPRNTHITYSHIGYLYLLLYSYSSLFILDSERSDECIDFAMMCVFFLCLSPRFGAVKVLKFSKVGPVSDRKVNLVGTLGGQNFKKNPKKVTEKREFLRKTSFRPNRFFYMVVNQKLIANLTFFDVDKKILDDQKHLKIEYKVPYDSNYYEICRKRQNLQFSFNVTITIYPQSILENFTTTEIFNFSENFPLKHKPPFSPTTENYILG
ncbi:Uncharacterized protein FWK35_00026645 [Aphis craccivora]|uniref:Uncharacterized protein n=1 Tax=Aphis craccivora TaxID=307492 RepID=A0A6G0VML1_APHCR|nr:Uncharacterized protein FWK35_00026645 [Aphis craccivora]